MREADVEIILQRAREAFPGAARRIISDNGPQFIAKDFREFIRICGMTHIRTSPYYPQSKGKIENQIGYVKDNALKSRSFPSLAAQNAHLLDWEDRVANTRIHGTTKQRINKAFEERERGALANLLDTPIGEIDQWLPDEWKKRTPPQLHAAPAPP